MIEEAILNYISTKLNPIQVCMEEPESKPEKYVLISYQGTGEDNHIYTGMVTAKSYANSMYEASLLNEQVKEVLASLIKINEITSSKLNASYPFNESTTKRYRYQCVFNINHY